MNASIVRAGRLPPALARAAACAVLCLISFNADAAPQAAAPQASSVGASAGRSTTKPVRSPEQAPSAAAAQPPASQPLAAVPRSAIDQRLICRDPPRGGPTEASASAESAPALTPPTFNLPRVLGALTLVLGLIFVLRYVLRRSIHAGALPGATNAVQVLTRSPLSPRQQLLLVRVGRRLLVVSDCNGQLNSLSEITDADEVAALVGQLRDEKLTSASRSFGNLLGMWRRGDDAGGEEGAEAEDADREEYPREAPDVPARTRDDEGDEAADPSVATARSEIHGLMERVRLMSHQFKRQ